MNEPQNNIQTMIEKLPPFHDLETKAILKKAALAELKGITNIIPNKEVLLATLLLQEAKASSEVENIITTHDELYKAEIDISNITKETKEVKKYQDALLAGMDLIKNKGILSVNHIIKIQSILVQNDAGIRTQIGIQLKNEQSGEIIYTPPQDPQSIKELMNNLEMFINDDTMSDMNPIVKMAVIHHQFESIHPFYDGNGRIGRIINVLYLVNKGLLDMPVLYLSRYIIENKSDYYRLLQEVRTKHNWQAWVLYMLDGVEQTAHETKKIITLISKLMASYKQIIRRKYPSMYSLDLINALFKHPYTTIKFLSKELQCHPQTAAKYLRTLHDEKLFNLFKVNKQKYYINDSFVDLFVNWRDKVR